MINANDANPYRKPLIYGKRCESKWTIIQTAREFALFSIVAVRVVGRHCELYVFENATSCVIQLSLDLDLPESRVAFQKFHFHKTGKNWLLTTRRLMLLEFCRRQGNSSIALPWGKVSLKVHWNSISMHAVGLRDASFRIPNRGSGKTGIREICCEKSKVWTLHQRKSRVKDSGIWKELALLLQ